MEMIRRSRKWIRDGISPAMLSGCLKEHRKRIRGYNKARRYYIGEHDILNRKQKQKRTPNNRIVSNYPKYITDMSVGYLFSNPISYYADTPTFLDDLTAAQKRADMDTHDSELGKHLSVFGIGYELLYMSSGERPEVSIALIDPKEAFCVYDTTVEREPIFGVYYYAVTAEDGSIVGYNLFIYTPEKESLFFMASLSETPRFVSEKPHWFGGIPLIEYWNNEEGMGDFAHVIGLVDAYNVLQSDRVNDKERFTTATLLIKNAELDEEKGEEMIQEGLLQLPGDSDASYITKTTNESDNEVLKNALAADIHKFSQTPDFTDEQFSGNTSGVAMKFKLLSLEYLAKVKERFFVEGLKIRLKLMASVLSIQGKKPIDVNKISISFNRSLPINELENAQTVSTYAASGTVSKETLLTQISFVKDKEDEIKKIREEESEKNRSLSQSFGYDDAG